MGTWGASIFSSDTACDVRADFREAIGEGKTPEQATNDLIKQYAPSDDDPEDSIHFWLGLAATQHRCGRLLPSVRDKALAILNAGADLAQWREEAPKDAPKRQAALDKLREFLLSPQPKPTRIKPTYHDRTTWQAGHAVSYRLLSGRLAILRVLMIEDNGKSQTPIVELCAWEGDSLPKAAALARLPHRTTKHFAAELARHDARASARLEHPDGISDSLRARLDEMHADADYQARVRDNIILHNGKFAVYSLSAREFPADRVSVIATGLPIPPKRATASNAVYFGGWRGLDKFLDESFDVR
jgi:hypothetical protein